MPVIAVCDTCGLPAKALQLANGDWRIPEGWDELTPHDKPGGWGPNESLTIHGIFCSFPCKAMGRTTRQLVDETFEKTNREAKASLDKIKRAPRRERERSDDKTWCDTCGRDKSECNCR